MAENNRNVQRNQAYELVGVLNRQETFDHCFGPPFLGLNMLISRMYARNNLIKRGNIAGVTVLQEVHRVASVWVMAKIFQANMHRNQALMTIGVAAECHGENIPEGCFVAANNLVNGIKQAVNFIRPPAVEAPVAGQQAAQAAPYEYLNCTPEEFALIPIPANAVVDLDQWYRCLANLSSYLILQYQPGIARCLTCSVLAYAKRGQISDRALENVNDQLYQSTNIRLNLTADMIFGLYGIIGSNFRPDHAREYQRQIMIYLGNNQVAMRLLLIVQRMAGSGLTAYSTVGRAILRFPDFGWEEVNFLIPADFINYGAARQAVGDNVFYGFNAQLGAARSTLFKSLFFVCSELLRVCSGEANFARYPGRERGVAHHNRFVEMVDLYNVGHGNAFDRNAVHVPPPNK